MRQRKVSDNGKSLEDQMDRQIDSRVARHRRRTQMERQTKIAIQAPRRLIFVDLYKFAVETALQLWSIPYPPECWRHATTDDRKLMRNEKEFVPFSIFFFYDWRTILVQL